MNEKICVECKHCTQELTLLIKREIPHFLCTRLREEISLVDGQTVIFGDLLVCLDQRYSYSATACGRAGRFFEPKT